jgi:imidazolonepropionase-like amidohydrolase
MEVLRTATTTPAAYLGRTADLGGVAAGKEADLVLLRKNPLEDIAHTATVETVVTNGRVFTRARLDQLLAEVERLAQAPKDP